MVQQLKGYTDKIWNWLRLHWDTALISTLAGLIVVMLYVILLPRPVLTVSLVDIEPERNSDRVLVQREMIAERPVSAVLANRREKPKVAITRAINVNTATVEQLQVLPGVGPVTAQRIADYRRQFGKFATVEDLLNVRGIGPKTLQKFRQHLTL